VGHCAVQSRRRPTFQRIVPTTSSGRHTPENWNIHVYAFSSPWSSHFQESRPLLACSGLIHSRASSVVCPDFLCLLVHTFSTGFDIDLSIRFTCCIYSVLITCNFVYNLSYFNISSLVLWSLHVYFAVSRINLISAAVSLDLFLDFTVQFLLPCSNIGKANILYIFMPSWTLVWTN
jgi:hypothetical protein